MAKLPAALLAVAAATLIAAAVAAAGLPRPHDGTRIKVPRSIGGVELKMDIRDADKAWGRHGDCHFRGFGTCDYESRNRRAGHATIEAARHGRVSSFGIFAGRSRNDEYVFKGKLRRFHTREGIGLGDKGAKLARAYPRAIRTANKTGFIIPGKGRSYMSVQTFGGKRITGITVVDGRHQG